MKGNASIDDEKIKRESVGLIKNEECLSSSPHTFSTGLRIIAMPRRIDSVNPQSSYLSSQRVNNKAIFFETIFRVAEMLGPLPKNVLEESITRIKILERSTRNGNKIFQAHLDKTVQKIRL